MPRRQAPLEQPECPVVGVEHHLLARARISADEEHSAVAQPDVRDLDLPQRQRAAAILPRALRLREVEPGREQGGGWMSGRASPPLATTDPRGDGIMQTVTAPGASARTFLIHMFKLGLDDNRYVVERYKSTFDGEIVRWPCKGKSKTGKQPHQVMSLSAVQRMRPERDEIIVCTGLKIAGSGIQYWGSAATGLFAERQRKGR